ncbi:MAG: nucleotidyltransferase domain-containing protein [Candidatus Burarchaeum sp.]|nr:nucleotidyltransferase domain-containing protein [Candidatus Burarchaeum sp.]MDO8339570.1 nucleotidyltransferase domain-containing protein [Candidatus Burarchaeum sp.]
MFKKLNLFSKTEMKLLSFISSKDGELYERQIADGAGISAASANGILKAFAKIGLLKQAKKGKMLFYRRNDDNPLLRQFKVFMTVNNLMPVMEKIAPLCSRIILFGSCATGRNGAQSDIDLFVLSGAKEKVRRALDGKEQIKAIILSGQEYAQLEKNDKPLYTRINSGIELYG